MRTTRRSFGPWPLLLLLVIAAGCGGSKPSGSGVTITFWQFWDSGVIRPILDRFEAENPGIKVDMQQQTWQNGKEKILAAVAAGTQPDLCELGSTWFAEFAAAGALRDVTVQTDSLRDALRMWEAATYHGRVYGVPWVMGTRALFYNKTLFRNAGLDDESAPDTWPRLMAAAKAIQDEKAGVYGYGRNAGERYILFKKVMPFLWSNGGEVLNADGTKSEIDSPGNVDALQFYLDLGPYSLTEKQDILDQAFKQGKIGALISGAWLFKTIPTDAPDLDYGVGLVPRPDDHWGTHRSFGGGELLVVFERSEKSEAALKLAAYLSRADNALALSRAAKSVQPAAKGLEDDPYFRDHPGEKVFLDQLSLAVFPPNIPRWSGVEAAVESAVEKAMHGDLTAEQALAEAGTAIDKILAEPE